MVSEIIHICKTFVSIGFSISNLYLIELMLIWWPIMIFCGWFYRRGFSMDVMDSLQSLLELLRLKFEFAFMKYSKFNVSKILSFCFSTLLESTLHQNLRIFDIKFSANAIAPFTLRWRISRCRCDSLMLPWKMILCSFLFKISTLPALWLSKRKIWEEIKCCYNLDGGFLSVL